MSEVSVENPEKTVLRIAITKAGNREIDVDPNELPINVYEAALKEGLKVLLNAKMAKITTKDLEGSDLVAARDAAFARAEKNLGDLLSGKLTKSARGASKAEAGISREVQTEAMRLAKAIVKDEIRAANMRISLVPASEITAYAKQVLADNPSIYAKAKENIEGRAAIKPKVSLAGLHEDANLVAKDEEKKAKAKAEKPLSKTQAGKVAPRRAKPGKEGHHVSMN